MYIHLPISISISIYLIHCILLRLMYRYPYPFFSSMERDQTSTSNCDGRNPTEPPTAPATGTDHRTSGSTRAEPSKAREVGICGGSFQGHIPWLQEMPTPDMPKKSRSGSSSCKVVSKNSCSTSCSAICPSHPCPKKIGSMMIWWSPKTLISYRPGAQSQVSAWLHRHGQQMWIRIS